MPASQPEKHPTLRDLVLLDVPGEVRISPDGSKIAALVRTTHWRENRYETHCQIYDTASGQMHPLTRSGNVEQVAWLDDHSLAVLKTAGDHKPGDAEPDEAKAQVYLYEGLVGEGWQATEHKTGVKWFAPFDGGLLFKAAHPEREEKKTRRERFGSVTHFEREISTSALYYTHLDEMRRYLAARRAASESEAEKLVLPVIELSSLFEQPLSIQEVIPSPAGEAVYLNCWPTDDMIHYGKTQVWHLQLQAPAALQEYLRRKRAGGGQKTPPASETQPAPAEDLSYLGRLTRLNLPDGAQACAVSPDGSELLLRYRWRDEKMFTREDLSLIAAAGAQQAADPQQARAQMRNLSAGLDREPMEVYWVAGGIYASYIDGVTARMARFDRQGQATPLDLGDWHIFTGFHISDAGRVALTGAHARSYAEVCLAEAAGPSVSGERWATRALSRFSQALAGWELGSVETIRWTSRDGVEIEGVLQKPANFDPQRKYPLVFIVHGGPSWHSAEYLLSYQDMRYYPAVQFNQEDILVLKPNYRGSIGRGQAFSELNVDNLGVGDLWDLESAIDHLTALGWVDGERVGCMGWSQGGYISAFAGLHSQRLRAVSVGAGISDWYTYHISNDIPQFTTDYLSVSPFVERAAYLKTAPIGNLSNAKTPMLIQHGSEDRRVPLSNAMELYRGLQARQVPVELFIYPGMAHPITKPRENYAVMQQNLTWFCHYLLGRALKLEAWNETE